VAAQGKNSKKRGEETRKKEKEVSWGGGNRVF
jgi:hypothetical protein